MLSSKQVLNISISIIVNIEDFRNNTRRWCERFKGMDPRVPVMDLDERLRAVEERLLLVTPNPDNLAKYPALKDAYENYRIVEMLVIGKNEQNK